MAQARTARERAREQITTEILTAARRRLTQQGPGELSLRAVARDVGMVSSAVYRYFASRDDLLTALLIDAYSELGDAVETADAATSASADAASRWLAACRAIRAWALAHPGDYALLYGSPVPGYAAPRDTVEPATRVIVVLIAIIAAGRDANAAVDRADGESAVRDATASDLETTIAGAIGFARERGLGEGTPEDADTALRVLMAWTTIMGTLSFELFGHLVGSVDDTDAYFDAVVRRLGRDLGLA